MKKIIHPPLDYFPVRQGHVFLRDIPVHQIADMAAGTPFYAYDRNAIRTRVATLKKQLPDFIQLHYAIKANPMPAVVQLLAELADGLDVASHGELHTALNSTMAASAISFAGPGKSDRALIAAIAAGVLINVESEQELQRIHQLGQARAITPRIALRINPSFELKSSGMKMGGGAKPFGIDEQRLPAVFRLVSELAVQFEGFHVFLGSQNLNPQAIMEGHNNTFHLLDRFMRECPYTTQVVNIGGGFGIPYFPGDTPLPIAPIAENLTRLYALYPSFRDKQIVLELGRYLVGEAGLYATQIVDKKQSHQETFLITDGGLHHHLANSGNFGQVIRKNYPILIHQQILNPAMETVNIAGPLCTPLDILAQKMPLPVAEIGDYVVVLQSGAYGKTASPALFLGHPDVPEILL